MQNNKTAKISSPAKITSLFLAVIMLLALLVQPTFFSADATTAVDVDFGDYEIGSLNAPTNQYIEFKSAHDGEIFLPELNVMPDYDSDFSLQLYTGEEAVTATTIILDENDTPYSISSDTMFNVPGTYLNKGDTVTYLVHVNNLTYIEGESVDTITFEYQYNDTLYKTSEITTRINIVNPYPGKDLITHLELMDLTPVSDMPLLSDSDIAVSFMNAIYTDTGKHLSPNPEVVLYAPTIDWYEGEKVDSTKMIADGTITKANSTYTAKTTFTVKDDNFRFTPNIIYFLAYPNTAYTSKITLSDDGKTLEMTFTYLTGGELQKATIDMNAPTVGLDLINSKIYLTTSPVDFFEYNYLTGLYINNTMEAISKDTDLSKLTMVPYLYTHKFESGNNYVFTFDCSVNSKYTLDENFMFEIAQDFKGEIAYFETTDSYGQKIFKLYVEFPADTLIPADTYKQGTAVTTKPSDLSKQETPLAIIPESSLPKLPWGETVKAEDIGIFVSTNLATTDKATLETFAKDSKLENMVYLDISLHYVQLEQGFFSIELNGPADIFIPNSQLGALANSTKALTVAHLKDDDTIETLATERVAGGIIIKGITSLSPFMLGEAISTAPTTSPTTSPAVPQTGDSPISFIIFVLFGISLVGITLILVSLRVKKNNK